MTREPVRVAYLLWTQVELVWLADWNKGKVLFLLARHLVWVDMALACLCMWQSHSIRTFTLKSSMSRQFPTCVLFRNGKSFFDELPVRSDDFHFSFASNSSLPAPVSAEERLPCGMNIDRIACPTAPAFIALGMAIAQSGWPNLVLKNPPTVCKY